MYKINNKFINLAFIDNNVYKIIFGIILLLIVFSGYKEYQMKKQLEERLQIIEARLEVCNEN
tara:strand:+ start:159 stop:344 length:186 start_codon:yes stop_codon:yes gene_type:complete